MDINEKENDIFEISNIKMLKVYLVKTQAIVKTHLDISGGRLR